MRHDSFTAFLQGAQQIIGKGPAALIFCEDEVEISTTLRHHAELGFKTIVAFMPMDFKLPEDIAEIVHRVPMERPTGDEMIQAVNSVSQKAPGAWLFYCFNAEYLFFPFCETRTIGEMLAFHTEERREAMLTYVIDLYAGDLSGSNSAVSLDDAMLDKTGYYALAREDAQNHNYPKERQLNFYGGLRWRFEEHVPAGRRNIDRVSLFVSKPGVTLRPDHTFSDEEMNTYSCEWHHNLTAAICSFRTAKALKKNPGSTYDIHDFKWHNSVPFEWHSRQLLDLGLMEPGQWF